jgi:transmembrane sensor
MKHAESTRLEAAQWVVDIHDVEDPSAEMLQRWVQWLDESPEHQREFDLAEAMWRHAAGVAGTDSKSDEDDQYDGTVSVAEWRRLRQTEGAGARPSKRMRFTSRYWQRAALLPAAAAACAAVFLVVIGRDSTVHGLREVFFTRTGESMNIVLPDGSRVALGARSQIAVDFTGGTRNVRLETGEAYFAVHKNPNRPFRVSVLDRVVTAVGTAFDVRRTSQRLVVAVSEGAVSVSAVPEVGAVPDAGLAQQRPPLSEERGAQLPSGATRVARGQQLSVSSNTGAQVPITLTSVDPTQAARWRDGWLVYRDEPLRDVLEDVERYTDRRLSIASSVPAGLRFTGAVFKDSAVEWLKSLPDVFPLVVNESGRTITVMAAPTSVAARTH